MLLVYLVSRVYMVEVLTVCSRAALPGSYLGMSLWLLEIGHAGRIYTMDMGKHYRLGLYFSLLPTSYIFTSVSMITLHSDFDLYLVF